VNDAGVGQAGRVLDQPPEKIRAMLDLDVRALVELTRRFVPAMVARGRGAVINVVSRAAFQPVPFLAVYAASKAFALSFTEALADELAGAAEPVMGKLDRIPVAIVRGLNWQRGDSGSRALLRDPARDLFR